MEVTREDLLAMDKERKAIEEEIMKLTEYLTGEGMPGINGKLIDNEGFPIANIDHYSITTARNKLACKQNDLKQLMERIEKDMSQYFTQHKQQNANKKEQKTDETEPIAIPVPSEDPKENTSDKASNITKEPFAIINMVMPNSPAEEAGLKEGDGIVYFDNILFKGVSVNPLQAIAKIANEKVNKSIPIDIVRKNDINMIEIKHLILIPHQWSGNGILGCKLNLIS